MKRKTITTQVIQTKRQPPLWTVKAGYNIVAGFSGANARARAEAYARENFGTFEVLAKPPTGKELKRASKLA